MKFFSRGLFFCLAAILLTACGGSDDSEDAPQTPQARLRVIHAAVDAPPVTFSLGEEVGEVSGIDYAKGSGLARLDADTYTGVFVSELPTGEADLTSAQELVFAEDVQYEVVLLGHYDSLETLVYQVPVDFDSSQSRIRIAHLGQALPSVEVHLSEANDPIGASVVVDALDYKETTSTTLVDAGTYRVRVTLPGSTDVIYDSGELNLGAGSDLFMGIMENAWTVNAADAQSPLVLSIFSGSGQSVIFDKDRAAYVRTFNISPDAGALDVFIDEDFANPIAQNLAFGQYTDSHSTIAKTEVDLLVSQTGNTTARVDQIVDFTGGGSYTMFLTGMLADIVPSFLRDTPRSIASQAGYRVVNMLTDDAELDVYVVAVGASIAEETPIIDEFASPVYTNYYSSAAGDFELVVTETDSKTPFMARIPLTFALGENYTISLHDGMDSMPAATIIVD